MKVLGTVEASEELIKDLYIDLRSKVNAWSEITKQTPQARMGYIGQHLVSVVTGFPGGKSGARGYDLVMNDGQYGEIKTCYRVDQLGKCKECGGVVSSLENECSFCSSKDIHRKSDSKWLIGIQHDQEFSEILDPTLYYFVLFEFENINDKNNNNIIASIWSVNPKTKGFAYCMIDYYFNIKPYSKSGAAFDMWPYSLKFKLTKPRLIYKSKIKENNEIQTVIFPTLHNDYEDSLPNLTHFSKAKTLTLENIASTIKMIKPDLEITSHNKKVLLETLNKIVLEENITNSELCDILADCIYLPSILSHKDKIPENIKQYFDDLQ